MIFSELVYNFKKKVGLKEDNKASFTFNSEQIKADSIRTLKDIGIGKNSVINVKTEKPLDYKPENTEQSKMLQNNCMNMGMNMNMNNYGNMNMNQNMNIFPNMNMYMNQNMGSGFFIMFAINGVYAGYMNVTENMLFNEVASHFFNVYPIMRGDGNIFFYKLKPIKSYSTKSLKELGIRNMSIIEFITNAPFNSFNFNYGIMGMNPYPFFESQNYENKEINNKDENIKIVFNYKIALEANKNTDFFDLSRKFCSQVDISNKIPEFYLGSQRISNYDDRTLSQLNIYNNSEIFVLLQYEKIINAKISYQGKIFCFMASREDKFFELIKRFCLKANIGDKHLKYCSHSKGEVRDDSKILDELGIFNQSIDFYVLDNE